MRFKNGDRAFPLPESRLKRTYVHMSLVTLTTLRKDLFRMVDRVLETGRPLTLVRNGRRLILSPEPVASQGEAREDRFDRMMAMGVREDAADFDPGDISDGEHMAWSPEDNPR